MVPSGLKIYECPLKPWVSIIGGNNHFPNLICLHPRFLSKLIFSLELSICHRKTKEFSGF